MDAKQLLLIAERLFSFIEVFHEQVKASVDPYLLDYKNLNNNGEFMGKPSDEKKSKIETDDAWNRALYGSPTIGGMVVVGIIFLIAIINIFKN